MRSLQGIPPSAHCTTVHSRILNCMHIVRDVHKKTTKQSRVQHATGMMTSIAYARRVIVQSVKAVKWFSSSFVEKGGCSAKRPTQRHESHNSTRRFELCDCFFPEYKYVCSLATACFITAETRPCSRNLQLRVHDDCTPSTEYVQFASEIRLIDGTRSAFPLPFSLSLSLSFSM